MSDLPTAPIEPMVLSDDSTVVAKYEPDRRPRTSYQSEADLEAEFMGILESQGYEEFHAKDEADLIANIRRQLETLNADENFTGFTDEEWKRFFDTKIAPASEDPAKKTERIQRDYIQVLEREDGTTKNIRLIDKTDVHRNHLQVMHQYAVPGSAQGTASSTHATRYDVTVLVNGLPLVHIELKRRGVRLREAFNQIGRYERESFSAGRGLFEYVQIYVISNGTETKYYSATTRRSHLQEAHKQRTKAASSKSFEFTMWWEDKENTCISDLRDFARTFFGRNTLLNVLTRYSVYTSEGVLMIMRPYQIVATEEILKRIRLSTNYPDWLGTPKAGGYVWHTTGSGKTLTSFKTAQLASKMKEVDKVLFVVDRKDLDSQTVKEYNRFEEGSVLANSSTAELARQMENPNLPIVVTTIQKLDNYVSAAKGRPIYDGRVVMIFDEAHRSQFGEMHRAITKAFRRSNIFGFTGTPIFVVNATAMHSPAARTTKQLFGDELHHYTIVDAIRDKNVLPFNIDFVNTMEKHNVEDKQVEGIDTNSALLAPKRITEIVNYTLQDFDRKTLRNKAYQLKDKRVRGFNALFAVQSIPAARLYYEAFKKAQKDRPESQRLKIATVFSYAPNPELEGGILGDESLDTDQLYGDDRAFLDSAIADYNATFGTNFSSEGNSFSNYYMDVTKRLRDRDLDMAIVVNMLLTGFDAPALNTLFIDKNVRQHGLIQAFSRTNRILNSVKAYGNIVSFRDLHEELDEALGLFGGPGAQDIVQLRPYSYYLKQYLKAIEELQQLYPVGQQILGETAQKDFIARFGEILKLKNVLVSFDSFDADNPLPEGVEQDYTSMYLDLYEEMRPPRVYRDKESIRDDVEFQMELVEQVTVNVDYILMMAEGYKNAEPAEAEAIKRRMIKSLDASPDLRSKSDLLEGFLAEINDNPQAGGGRIDVAWTNYVVEQRDQELAEIIEEERLKPEPTRSFMRRAFRSGEVPTSGETVTKILPKVSRFAKNDAYAVTKERAPGKLETFYDRYAPLLRVPEA
ncbi:type I restriction endonuclease subunit R [Neoactinobaculum massilliense]|uniref:type I restriction endonuclease subunit R n=1 Tax=Neoactinobaculum massilliense TaxID=2364794 RepID=UPI000F526F67|nr:type I restriction endonuclease subunit R [Neoactinobaculum massilliense]